MIGTIGRGLLRIGRFLCRAYLTHTVLVVGIYAAPTATNIPIAISGTVAVVAAGPRSHTIVTLQVGSGLYDIWRVYHNGGAFGPYEYEMDWLGYSADGQTAAWFAGGNLLFNGKTIGEYHAVDNLVWAPTGGAYVLGAQLDLGSGTAHDFRHFVIRGQDKIGPYYNRPEFYYNGVWLIVVGEKKNQIFVTIVGDKDYGPYDQTASPIFSQDGAHFAMTGRDADGVTVLGDRGIIGKFAEVKEIAFAPGASQPSFLVYTGRDKYEAWHNGKKLFSHGDLRDFRVSASGIAFVAADRSSHTLRTTEKKYGPHQSIDHYTILANGEPAYIYQYDAGVRVRRPGLADTDVPSAHSIFADRRGTGVWYAWSDERDRLMVSGPERDYGPYQSQSLTQFFSSSGGAMAWTTEVWSGGGFWIRTPEKSFGPYSGLDKARLSPAGKPCWISTDKSSANWLHYAADRYGPFKFVDAPVFSPDGKNWAAVTASPGGEYRLLVNGKPGPALYNVESPIPAGDSGWFAFRGQGFGDKKETREQDWVTDGTISHPGALIRVNGSVTGVVWLADGQIRTLFFR